MRLVSLILPVVSCGISLAAPVTTPITAKMTSTTYEVGGNGQTSIISQESGTFARRADGSEVTRFLDPSTGQPRTAAIRANGQSIVIKYLSKRYTVGASSPLAPDAVPFIQKPGMESQTINGIYVVGISITDGKTGQVVGKAWFSPDYKITVRTETERTSAVTGKTIRMVQEMSDIQIGAAPDPNLFTVPAGFTATAGSADCKFCGGSN